MQGHRAITADRKQTSQKRNHSYGQCLWLHHLVFFESDGALNLSETLAVLDPAYGALLELHDVLRQSPCFVAENVLDLPQLLC